MFIYAVAEVVRYLRGVLDFDPVLADLWVSGEVSNLSRSTAGHVYFTLKDDQAQLRCVFFRSQALRGGGALVANGAAVIAHGRLSLYDVSGALQLYVDLVQPEGMGRLHREFEALKLRLEQEGLFDPARKRPLPPFPRRVGVVTSPTGAVLHDILTVLERRYPLVEVLLAPARVQGDGAAESVVDAVRTLNQEPGVDVLILARGGGSLEELWAFNEEAVARAVFASRVPVVCGVGHETDVTIADLVADLRAPTPSAAAELVVPDRQELLQRVLGFRCDLEARLSDQLEQDRRQVGDAEDRLARAAPNLARYRQRLDDLMQGGRLRLDSMLALQRERLRSRVLQLGALGPQATLGRGYAVVRRREGGRLVSSASQVEAGDGVLVTLGEGGFVGEVTSTWKPQQT